MLGATRTLRRRINGWYSLFVVGIGSVIGTLCGALVVVGYPFALPSPATTEEIWLSMEVEMPVPVPMALVMARARVKAPMTMAVTVRVVRVLLRKVLPMAARVMSRGFMM